MDRAHSVEASGLSIDRVLSQGANRRRCGPITLTHGLHGPEIELFSAHVASTFKNPAMQLKHLITVFWLGISAGFAAAQGVNPPAGEYIFERGSGSLHVKPGGAFDLNTIGANAHLCELDGKITRGSAKIDDSQCVVNFATKGNGETIVVTTNGAEQCRDNCGMRATFEGTYSRAKPACTEKALRDSRSRFKAKYDAKKYSDARNTMSAVISTCEKTLDWLSAGRMQNDLALTQYKLGDKAGCLKTLQPLSADAAKSDEKIKEDYPPADAEDYLPIVKSTRFNLKLCGS